MTDNRENLEERGIDKDGFVDRDRFVRQFECLSNEELVQIALAKLLGGEMDRCIRNYSGIGLPELSALQPAMLARIGNGIDDKG